MTFLNTSKMAPRRIGVLVGLWLAHIAAAGDLSVGPKLSEQNLAFARYIASLDERDPFTESGPVLMLIHASLPGLYKEADMLTIRQTGEDERSEYGVLYTEGDGAAREQVMGRYFEMQDQIEDLPLSSILVTPANYKFHLRGLVKGGENSAYVYDVTPRKAGPGLIKGQLWMDAETGGELLLAGRLMDAEDLDFVRETKLVNGKPVVRITHMGFILPIVGRGELIVTEYPLPTVNENETPYVAPTSGESLTKSLR